MQFAGASAGMRHDSSIPKYEAAMQKLRLDLDALQVQSFATLSAGTVPFGTVHAGQKEPTGWQDPHCSAVLFCESKLGCSEVPTCHPTHTPACRSEVAPCVSD